MAAAPRPGASKVYVAAIEGKEAFIQIGEEIRQLVPNEVYETEGATIFTDAGTTVRVVFSNGTAVEIQSNTRVKVKRFRQAPFRAHRTDVTVEPSISDVQIELAAGNIVVAMSRPLAGSKFMVETRHGEVRVQGGTMVVNTSAAATDVTVLSGSCIAYGRSSIGGSAVSSSNNNSSSTGAAFNVVSSGDSAVMREEVAVQAAPVVVVIVNKTPTEKHTELANQVAETVVTKTAVYFEEVKAKANAAANPSSTATPTSAVAAFNNEKSGDAATEIVATPVVPISAPPEITLSVSRTGS